MIGTLISIFYSLILFLLIFISLLWLLKELTMGVFRSSVSMKGKVVVITGGNAGIGLESAIDLAGRGARVVLGCRSKERGEKAVEIIKKRTGNDQVVLRLLDLQNLESVKNFAEKVSSEEEKIDVLLNNAGMSDGRGNSSWAVGKSHLSKDNLEIITQTNHLSPFLLTNLLKESLAKSGNARVVNVSSLANMSGNIDLNNINYESNHGPEALVKNYHNSKLMNILFTIELSKRWSDLGITSYSCHPGVVRSNFFDNYQAKTKQIMMSVMYLLGKNNWQGAQSSLFLCVQPGIEKMSGGFFVDCRRSEYLCNKQAKDDQLCEGLWKRSEELVGLA